MPCNQTKGHIRKPCSQCNQPLTDTSMGSNKGCTCCRYILHISGQPSRKLVVCHLLVASHDQHVTTSQGGKSNAHAGSVQLANQRIVEVGGINHTDCLGTRLEEVSIQVDVVACICT